MVENPMFDVFLAHNSKDKPQVRRIANELRQRGLNPWLDEEQMWGGDTPLEEIQKGLSQSKSVAFFIGLDGSGNWQGNLELPITVNLVLYSGLRLIPILLPGVREIPKNPQYFFLSTKIWISFENIDDANALNRLEKSIRKQIKAAEIKPDNRSHSQAQYFTENLGNNVTLDLVAIPGGKFLMGSPEGEGYDQEKPQHEVTVQPFFMGKYPVTQAQWQAIALLPKVECDLDPNPAYFKDREDSDRRPVENVSWEDAVEFCQRLSQQTGKEYRLPTEAEWEYACRARTTTPFHFGETISTDLANYRGTDWEYQGKVYPGNYGKGLKGIFREQTTPVGSFLPNAFGLYDMHGNVWEWCEDDWHENYMGAPTDGSAWLKEDGNTKVIYGGSWDDIPDVCRSAFRSDASRGNRYDNIGFRVVCVAPRAT